LKKLWIGFGKNKTRGERKEARRNKYGVPDFPLLLFEGKLKLALTGRTAEVLYRS
jgi:hypothetical protein